MTTTTVFKTVTNEIRHWWLLLIAGICFIAVGILVFKTPMESYLALSIVFSVMFFVNGIFEIFYSIANRKELDGWGWTFVGGIIDLVLGIILISSPLLSLVVLPFFVGFGVMFRSMIAMGGAFELKSYGEKSWRWILVIAIGGLLFSFFLLWNPVFAGLTIIIWTAMAFITIGLLQIILGLKLRNLHKLTAVEVK